MTDVPIRPRGPVLAVAQVTHGRRFRPWVGCTVALALTLTACGTQEGGAESSDPITLYTCVSDETIQPVIEAFEESNPGTQVDLFRAPTGELNARVAGDVRSGGLRADVIWGCDPLTVQDFVDQGLVGGWVPPDAEGVPSEFRTDDYIGVAVLYMLVVHREGVPAPRTWSDLTGPEYADALALPDPTVAASALGALGYFAADPDYGVEFYGDLKANGAVQVGTPDQVTTGVAQGVYDVGITIANSAYAAESDGSPVDVVWPEPGAIAIYGPVALARHSADSESAKQFIAFVVSEDGQSVLGRAGSYPTRPDAPSPTIPTGAPVVSPDWAAVGAGKDAVLTEYQQLFGG
jgi:iron(III) transport system substrate-binding protein